jgi:hypothetical protein
MLDLDDDFVDEQLRGLVGNEQRPTAERAEEDPEQEAIRESVMRGNELRYLRVINGRFFEVNR